MRSRAAISIAVALTGLALVFAGVSGAAEEGPYPIWWSPALELESLDDIDARLNRELRPGASEFKVYKRVGEDYVPAVMDTCAKTIQLSEDGYQAPYNHSLKAQWSYLAWCRAIDLLKSAKPALQSYVRNFRLDQEAVNYLPAMIELGTSCSMKCRRHAANEKGIGWSKLDSFHRIFINKYNELEIENEHSNYAVQVLSMADFNSDGIEDIVILNGYYATHGTAGMTEIFVLTRGTDGGVLRVLDPDRYLCPNYECRGPYEFR